MKGLSCMRKVLLVLTLLAGTVAFTACSDDDNEGGGNSSNPLVGTWYQEYDDYRHNQYKLFEVTFEPDFILINREYVSKGREKKDYVLKITDYGKYEIDGRILYLTYDDGCSAHYLFTVTGNTLKLSSSGNGEGKVEEWYRK